MKTLDKYILREFLKLFFILLSGVIFLFIIVNFFERLDLFVAKKASLMAIIKFYLFQLPYLYVLFSPVGGLLSAFFSIGEMARKNEILALKASGISIYRLITPLIVTGFILSIFSFAINDTIVPLAQAKKRKVYDIEIKKLRKSWSLIYATNFSFIGNSGFIYYFGRIDALNSRGDDVSVIKLNKHGKITFRVDAKYGFYKDSLWVLFHATERVFKNDREVSVRFFPEKAYPELSESPFEILKERKELDEMDIRTLWRFINFLKNSGFDYKRELVEFHTRFSFPFANLIVLLFALALAVETRGKGRAYGFGISVFLSFFYWWVLQATKSIAGVGKLNPFISAWFPNIIFLILAAIALTKVKS